MKKKRVEDMTFEEIKAAGLCEISKTPLQNTIAKSLNTPAKIKAFKMAIIEEFNKTREMGVFLESLKIIAIAQGNIAELARKSGVSRPNVYKILSKDNNPRINSLLSIAHNLGVTFKVAGYDEKKKIQPLKSLKAA
jgi:probable addiction module antidote protein